MENKQQEDYVWWKHGVVYHIYTRSFFDSNNDGIGDLQGIIKKFDYLVSLGIDAIWLSPIYKSPLVDYGYDVSDYRKIDPDYGTIDDFKEFLELCHSKGIKLIMDMVLNHTSDQHPWFLDSKSSKLSEKRDFYIWKKKKPNNWKSAFERTGWKYDSTTKEYYYHSFFQEQPDLNWRNPKVQKAMFKEMEFWLDLGVDGFRLDVINYIVKDEKFRDDPSFVNQLLFKPKLYSRNRKTSIRIVSELRKLVESYGDRALIGEIFVLPPGDSSIVSKFLGKNLEALNLAFDFSLIFTLWSARKYYLAINNMYQYLKQGAWATIVFSNHDLKRIFSKSLWNAHRMDKAKLRAMLLFTLKGTPFIYYGEEIGMGNANIAKKEIKDKLGKRYWPFYKGRDCARTPMQWSNEPNAGFSNHITWLPVNTNYKSVNVASQQSDKESFLNLFQSLIKLRKKLVVLSVGEIELISCTNNILIYKRTMEDDQVYILLNFSNSTKNLDSYSNKKVLFSTHTLELVNQAVDKFYLHPFEGVILHP